MGAARAGEGGGALSRRALPRTSAPDAPDKTMNSEFWGTPTSPGCLGNSALENNSDAENPEYVCNPSNIPNFHTCWHSRDAAIETPPSSCRRNCEGEGLASGFEQRGVASSRHHHRLRLQQPQVRRQHRIRRHRRRNGSAGSPFPPAQRGLSWLEDWERPRRRRLTPRDRKVRLLRDEVLIPLSDPPDWAAQSLGSTACATMSRHDNRPTHALLVSLEAQRVLKS